MLTLFSKLFSKENLYYIIAIIILALGLSIIYHKYQKLQEDYSISQANVKAYDVQLSNKNKEIRVFQITEDQLQNMNDSIIVRMDSLRKVLKLKPKTIQTISYQERMVTKSDTINSVDTLFRKDLHYDTIVGDNWVSNRIKLDYPKRIEVNTNITLQNYIIVHKQKETINPPKKFFLFRWFQKKQEVLKVEVIENNPYVQNKTSKFIQVLH